MSAVSDVRQVFDLAVTLKASASSLYQFAFDSVMERELASWGLIDVEVSSLTEHEQCRKGTQTRAK
jgi:hypothetical protein